MSHSLRYNRIEDSQKFELKYDAGATAIFLLLVRYIKASSERREIQKSDGHALNLLEMRRSPREMSRKYGGMKCERHDYLSGITCYLSYLLVALKDYAFYCTYGVVERTHFLLEAVN